MVKEVAWFKKEDILYKSDYLANYIAVSLAHNWGTLMWVAVKTDVSVRPEAFLGASRNCGSLQVWTPNQGTEVSVWQEQGPLLPILWAQGRPGTRATAQKCGTPGWLYVPNCVSELLLLGGGRNPSSADVGVRWSTASAGMASVLSKPTASLDSHLKNLNCADFTFKEISLMSIRNEKENKKAVGFSLLLNLLGKSGTPCISLFEEVLTSEI